VAAADRVRLEDQRDRVVEVSSRQRRRHAFLEADRDRLALTATSSRQNATPMIGATIWMPL